MTTAIVTSPGGQRRRVRPEPEHRTVERRQIDGTVIDTVSLDPQIFGLAPNKAVLHQVITAQLAAARAGTQSTRTRAEVAGGGAKPFKQKGTGRARQGSIRSPQWSGGGIALGPKPRSYRQRTPKKMIRLALVSALSDRASDGKVVVVDEWSFPVPRTKDAVAALTALELQGRVLVVLGPDDGIPDRSFANLSDVQTLQGTELNAYDILRSDWVVFTDATLPGETTPAPGKPAPARRARKAPVSATAAAETEPDAFAEDAGTDSVAEDAGTDSERGDS
jgi:large subunit ribosomal protein L4